MSTSMTSMFRRLALLASFAGAFLVAAPDADAQRRAPRRAEARQSQGQSSVASRAARYRPQQVSNRLQQKLGEKKLMAVRNGDDARRYKEDMKDTVEVLFMPSASSYGHLLVRVGDRAYDLPGSFGARTLDVERLSSTGRDMYGFVFESTRQGVAELQRDFEAFIATNPKFSMSGSGSGGCYSCAGFVTHVLSTKAPELQVGLSASAVGSARRLLNTDMAAAVTLYGRAADAAGSDDFRFEKLE